MTDSDYIPTAMSTSALENKLKDLKDKSNKQSQVLTAKLASSQSGQNLLHIGTSLQTLPPDLHTLLTQLHPVLSCTEATEKEYLQRLQKLVECGNDIRSEERRVGNAKECAGLYEDLIAAENRLRKDASQTREKVVPWEEGDSYSSGMCIATKVLFRRFSVTVASCCRFHSNIYGLMILRRFSGSGFDARTMRSNNIVFGKGTASEQ